VLDDLAFSTTATWSEPTASTSAGWRPAGRPKQMLPAISLIPWANGV
jgi:hypothetical protein